MHFKMQNSTVESIHKNYNERSEKPIKVQNFLGGRGDTPELLYGRGPRTPLPNSPLRRRSCVGRCATDCLDSLEKSPPPLIYPRLPTGKTVNIPIKIVLNTIITNISLTFVIL